MVGNILVVGPLTPYVFLNSMCDSKAVQMNVPRCLDLVSLFNGISPFVGYLIQKPSLQKKYTDVT